MSINGVEDVVALIVGIFIVSGTAGSLVRTTVMPRAVASRLSVFIGRRVVYRTVLRVSHLFGSYESKDRVLSYGAHATTCPV
jgi:hypothetical protein